METLDQLMERSAKEMNDLVEHANADAVMMAEAFTLGKFAELQRLQAADLQRRMEARYAAPGTNS
jgi:hypothetical protein